MRTTAAYVVLRCCPGAQRVAQPRRMSCVHRPFEGARVASRLPHARTPALGPGRQVGPIGGGGSRSPRTSGVSRETVVHGPLTANGTPSIVRPSSFGTTVWQSVERRRLHGLVLPQEEEISPFPGE